jgi:hypothetical protein
MVVNMVIFSVVAWAELWIDVGHAIGGLDSESVKSPSKWRLLDRESFPDAFADTNSQSRYLMNPTTHERRHRAVRSAVYRPLRFGRASTVEPIGTWQWVQAAWLESRSVLVQRSEALSRDWPGRPELSLAMGLPN